VPPRSRAGSGIEGGIAAWEAAGYRRYSDGMCAASKAFAKVVKHEAGTPWISVPLYKN
jgi:hypothetical protein